jgi:signal transduction histidine kinase/ActR/RegA family two-component response regulator
MIGTVGRLLLLVAGLLVVLTYFLVRGATPDAAQRERTLDALRALLLSGAALERDVLAARTGLLRNYDPLVAAMAELRASTGVLAEAADIGARPGRAELRRHADALAAAVDRQEELVDEFKSRNAILQNSLNFFAHASRAPLVAAEPQEELAGAVAALANAMLGFLSDARPAAAAPVAAALDRLVRAPAVPASEDLRRALVVHGRVILDALPAVDGIVAQLLASEAGARAKAFHDLYLEQHRLEEKHAEFFRLLLYTAAILLVAYLAYLFWRLRANAAALAARLDFERIIGEISTEFINLPRGRLEAAIGDALARLARNLDADRAYILLGEPGEAPPDHSYQWSARQSRLPAASIEEVLQAVSGGSDRLRGPPPALQARGVRSWLCLSMSRAGRRLGFLGFESERTTSWSEDDLALLGTAAEIFANALDRERTETERESLETQLRQAQRMEAIGTLSGGIAHEFNNTLGAILGYAEMALATLRRGGSPGRHIEQVMTAGQRAKAVVDQILAFARRGSAEPRPVQLQAAVEEALELLRVSLPRTLTVRTRLEAAEASVLGDAGQLQQVVVNLCTNAAQAMVGRGVLEVTLEATTFGAEEVLSHGRLPPGDYARLAVSDTGPGIDAAIMGRIFDPFFTTKAPGEGTGLGLATVHGVVLKHGGALDVRSSPQGSAFTAYFPCGVAPAATVAGELPVPHGNGETILLVDDEKPLVLLGEEMLAALGYEPVGSSSATAALSAVRSDPRRFDLVLTDEAMPEMTGTEFARALHALRPDLPIVLMTGYIGPAAANRLRAAGVREILRKPLLTRDIAETLARHLRNAA